MAQGSSPPLPAEPQPLDEEPLIGTVLDGRYRILERIAIGGMGSVYRAVQTGAVGRDVAVKVLNTSSLKNDVVVRRFENEGRIIAQLRHPNTLHLIDSGRFVDGRMYIVTDLLRGEPLDVILTRGAMSARRTLEIMAQVSGSLAEAHGMSIVHRDLKPGNIFMEHVGEERVVKVLDFGIAKLANSDGLTMPMQIFGTPGYMSPEQARGEEVDARSDIYSLGAIAYECLSGRPAYIGSEAVQILIEQGISDPPPLQDFVTDQGPETEEVIQLITHLLGRLRQDRPQSVAEVAAEVERLRRNLTSAPMGSSSRSSSPGPIISSPSRYGQIVADLLVTPTYDPDSDAPNPDTRIDLAGSPTPEAPVMVGYPSSPSSPARYASGRSAPARPVSGSGRMMPAPGSGRSAPARPGSGSGRMPLPRSGSGSGSGRSAPARAVSSSSGGLAAARAPSGGLTPVNYAEAGSGGLTPVRFEDAQDSLTPLGYTPVHSRLSGARAVPSVPELVAAEARSTIAKSILLSVLITTLLITTAAWTFFGRKINPPPSNTRPGSVTAIGTPSPAAIATPLATSPAPTSASGPSGAPTGTPHTEAEPHPGDVPPTDPATGKTIDRRFPVRHLPIKGKPSNDPQHASQLAPGNDPLKPEATPSPTEQAEVPRGFVPMPELKKPGSH